jgi:hypothetical protein
MPLLSRVSAANPGKSYAYDYLLYDHRSVMAGAFGQKSQQLGAEVTGIEDDIVALLNEGLYARWRQGPIWMAGLTSYLAFTAINQMSRSYGHRKVFSIEHHRTDKSQSQHLVKSSVDNLNSIHQTFLGVDCSENLGHVLADIVNRVHGPFRPLSRQVVTSENIALESSGHGLVTWVIGPETGMSGRIN